ncbi:nuclear transport factor 2 family protein [Eudoraea chungangensis]|uniref:nuclear transport factor 2 family protein n=1 Tax=Eudoraea chungangensis TaxID=1481905 RepID=UPI0023EDB8A0|nr:nuclear transport factor 2 family protein [Eudoraea chungangensis]
MKIILTAVLVQFIFFVNAQENESLKVQRTIETFFEGFHKQDSLLLTSSLSSEVSLKTIGKNKESGKTELREVNFNAFLHSILSIPDSVKFQEKLLSFNIQIDGDMAHGWTPYEFWYNDSFSHCGVNSFQLVKEKDKWSIVSIMDTRRKEPCFD